MSTILEAKRTADATDAARVFVSVDTFKPSEPSDEHTIATFTGPLCAMSSRSVTPVSSPSRKFTDFAVYVGNALATAEAMALDSFADDRAHTIPNDLLFFGALRFFNNANAACDPDGALCRDMFFCSGRIARVISVNVSSPFTRHTVREPPVFPGAIWVNNDVSAGCNNAGTDCKNNSPPAAERLPTTTILSHANASSAVTVKSTGEEAFHKGSLQGVATECGGDACVVTRRPRQKTDRDKKPSRRAAELGPSRRASRVRAPRDVGGVDVATVNAARAVEAIAPETGRVRRSRGVRPVVTKIRVSSSYVVPS